MPASIWNVSDFARFASTAGAIALLAACTSTEATLDPNAVRSQQTAQPVDAAQPAQGQQPATTAPALQTTGDAPPPQTVPTATPPATTPAQPTSLRLAGMVGAPSQAIEFLTARMQQQGPTQNLAIVPAGGTAPYAIRGLASTSPDSGKTVIDFTWELTDRAGATVHRASGRRMAAGPGEGWQAVTRADMDAIADEILAGVSSWLATRP